MHAPAKTGRRKDFLSGGGQCSAAFTLRRVGIRLIYLLFWSEKGKGKRKKKKKLTIRNHWIALTLSALSCAGKHVLGRDKLARLHMLVHCMHIDTAGMKGKQTLLWPRMAMNRLTRMLLSLDSGPPNQAKAEPTHPPTLRSRSDGHWELALQRTPHHDLDATRDLLPNCHWTRPALVLQYLCRQGPQWIW